jgi:uncharacterized protein YkwD
MPRLHTLAAATAALLGALAIPAVAPAHAPRYRAERVAVAHIALVGPGHKHVRTAQRPQAPTFCPNADITANAGNLDAFRAAVVCLHNQIRGAAGLPLLRNANKLRRAAEGHSADMVGNAYFEHTAPDGSTMVDRILASGYVSEDQGWMLGENLEWGTGTMATPRGAMDAWMESPGHRANILKRGYRNLGVGLVLGTPTRAGDGVTITVDFGTRF